MNQIAFILLQEISSSSQKLPNSAPESSFSFWFISQVIITGVIFVGVYFILKPVFGKKKEMDKDKE